MTVEMTLKVDGLEEILRKVDKAQRAKVRADVMYEVVSDVLADVEPYPPATSANRPPGPNGYSWYQRGFGVKTTTGKAWKTSERMDTQWKVERTRTGARLKNDASYSGYLHDKEKQVGWARGRGWRAVQKVWDVNRRKYEDTAERSVERQLDKA